MMQLPLLELPAPVPVVRPGQVERRPDGWPVTMAMSTCVVCLREVPTCCIVGHVQAGTCGKCSRPILDAMEAAAIASAIEAARTYGPPHPRHAKVVWKADRERVKERARELADEKRQARKLKNAARAIARQQDKDGLFSQVKEYETPTERDTRFAVGHALGAQQWRDREAQQWREARAILRALPLDRRAEVVYRWNVQKMPATAVFFLVFLRTQLAEAR